VEEIILNICKKTESIIEIIEIVNNVKFSGKTEEEGLIFIENYLNHSCKKNKKKENLEIENLF